MVLEVLAAVGLAGNIVQFIDFSTKLFSESTEIYQSAVGASTDNIDWELVVNDLRDLSSKLQAPESSPGVKQRIRSLDEERIDVLAKKCMDLSEELLAILRDLRVKGNPRAWKSFRQAIRSVRKRDHIERIQKRLKLFRDELTMRLITVLNDQQSSVLRTVRELARNSNRLELNRAAELMQMKTEVLAAIEHWRPSNLDGTPGELGFKLTEMAAEGGKIALVQAVLGSLSFQSMRIRHSKIPEAFEKTFEWAFYGTMGESQQPNSLLSWLESQDGIYWISGKPGSGKSTLMKFLSDHSRTSQALYSWGQGSKLVLASYYFWSAGTELQKTQEGLLRTLLFDIARHVPEIIPTVFAKRCQDLISLHGPQSAHALPWARSELLEAADILAQLNLDSFKFCLFIDGLDEYEGDHHEVVALMNRLARCPHFKLCLSSRPWNIFEDAFGQDPTRKLYLQDLTREDIRMYVQRNLERNRRFSRLCQSDQRYTELVLEIVEKSNGVFLWVYLVVRSLLQGLTNADSIPDLQRRVQRFPAELEPFFRHMLDSVEDVYQEQTALFFMVALEATSPLGVLTYTYLDEEDPNFPFTIKVKPIHQGTLPQVFEEMRKRLEARCKGLLELVEDSGGDEICSQKIDFLHRTVRDYLRTPHIQAILQRRASPNFDPTIFICRALLAEVKSCPQNVYHFRDGGHLDHLLRDLRSYALLHEMKQGLPAFPELEEIEKVLSVYRDVVDSFPDVIGFSANWYKNDLFVTCCAEGELVLYVKRKLSQRPELANARMSGRPILHHSLTPNTTSRCVNPKLVQLLLEHGAQPNDEWGNWTTWGHFIHTIYQRQTLANSLEKSLWFDVVYAMLEHGADPYRADIYSPESVIEHIFSKHEAEALKALIPQRSNIGQKFRSWLGWS